MHLLHHTAECTCFITLLNALCIRWAEAARIEELAQKQSHEAALTAEAEARALRTSKADTTQKATTEYTATKEMKMEANEKLELQTIKATLETRQKVSLTLSLFSHCHSVSGCHFVLHCHSASLCHSVSLSMTVTLFPTATLPHFVTLTLSHCLWLFLYHTVTVSHFGLLLSLTQALILFVRSGTSRRMR